MTITSLPPAPRNPQGTAPLRRPNSVRRTSTVDMSWPGGRGTQLRLNGRARDGYTSAAGGAPTVLATDEMSVGVNWERKIEDIAVNPARDGIGGLVGAVGGGHLRLALKEVVPDEREAGTPLYLLLDDISGTSLIAGFAWSQWIDDWFTPTTDRPIQRRKMESICAGFRPGSSALREDGSGIPAQNTCPVGPLVHPDDLDGWHRLNELPGASMRRARRIDVWHGEGVVEIDAMFQDSAGARDVGRIAVHEYRIAATADVTTLELLTIDAQPHVLPFPECPAAAANTALMVGKPLRELRTAVLEELRGTAGCTHLNDALRSLAEVPVLADALRRAQ